MLQQPAPYQTKYNRMVSQLSQVANIVPGGLTDTGPKLLTLCFINAA